MLSGTLSRRAFPAVVMGACLMYACEPSAKRYPPWVDPLVTTTGGGGAGGNGLLFDAGDPGPPPADAEGLCGNDVHHIVSTPPNVYFILDKSGSMLAPVGGGNRYTVVQGAAATIVAKLRYLIRAGAAVFPSDASCGAGAEVFPMSFNDPLGFDKATKNIAPDGGTPTAATLEALYPKLTSYSGNTIVVLATDGGPNCNSFAGCDANDCMVNIENLCGPAPSCCSLGENCCAPGTVWGPDNCVDRKAVVAAIKALADAGVKVYVIGIPGSQGYSSVLADMALAGGAAIAAYPFYYKVDDLATISNVLGSAAASAIPCVFTVDEAPMVPSLTNVYFDKQVVLQDPDDGWTWTSPTEITLHGAACGKLHSGQVGQVQIVSGCPTEVAK